MPWPHFTTEELSCPCCGAMEMDAEFMAKMELLRLIVGFPLPVTSGYRCPAHNMAVSKRTGAAGPHTTGKAADIAIYGHNAAVLVQVALNQGFRGVGIRQRGDWRKRIVHIDVCERTDQIIWTY